MKKILLLMMCCPVILSAQNGNGVMVSNLTVKEGTPATVTFNVSWQQPMPVDVWSDTVWVFVDYNDNLVMKRLPLEKGATLTATSAPGVGKVMEVSGNNSGVWVVGNARSAGSFSATVQLLTANATAAGACAYASNYLPVAEYIDATHLSIKGMPMYKMVIAAGAKTYTAYSDGSYTLSRGHTLQSFIDKTGAPGTMTCKTPDVYELKASAASFCAGSAVTFALSGTTSGRTYRLLRGSSPVDAITGSGSPATFTGAFVGAGVYTAQVDAEGEYCPAAMSGTRAVVEKPMPVLLSSGSVTQTVDQNTPITNIIYTAANAAIALSSGTASLPAGVSGTPNGATFTISGTPTAAGTFNYTVTATHVDGGCTNALSGDIIVLPSTPPHAASTQTWTFGTSTLTWSDRIVVSPSNCTSVTSFSTSDANATQYRIYQGLYFYTWTCVMNNATVFCPAPWRVPTLADVQDLINNTNGATLVNTWGSGGWFSGSSYATNVFPYWSSSPCSNTENVYDIEYTNSTLYTDCNYKSWAFQSVCTK